MVLIAPDTCRPRSLLSETLWSDRGRKQAMGSLRQAISEIRTALGPHADCLTTADKQLGFKSGTVASDLPQAAQKQAQGKIFLEDVPVQDPRFGDWLSDMRTRIGVRATLQSHPMIEITTEGRADPFRRRLLGRGIAETIGDWCALQIASVRDNPDDFARDAPDALTTFLIDARLDPATDGVAAQVSLSRTNPSIACWSSVARLGGPQAHPFDDTELFRLVNRSADRTLLGLAPRHPDVATNGLLDTGTLGAAWRIFRNEPGDLEAAARQLKANFDIHREGIYLAWLAYLTTFELAEKNETDKQALKDKAIELTTKALDLDPYGSMTLALCSYVHSLVIGDLAMGHDLASRAIDSNRANVLAWVFRGASHFYAGEGEKALENTRFAQRISGDGPYSYVIDTFSCAAATSAGRFDEALVLAERAASKAPHYKAPLRYQVAIHAARGDLDALRKAIARLRRLEPGFSIDSLHNSKYPVPGLRASGLVKSE